MAQRLYQVSIKGNFWEAAKQTSVREGWPILALIRETLGKVKSERDLLRFPFYAGKGLTNIRSRHLGIYEYQRMRQRSLRE